MPTSGCTQAVLGGRGRGRPLVEEGMLPFPPWHLWPVPGEAGAGLPQDVVCSEHWPRDVGHRERRAGLWGQAGLGPC